MRELDLGSWRFVNAGLRVSYPALVHTFARALGTRGWSAAARRAVWHDNAIRIYRIDSR